MMLNFIRKYTLLVLCLVILSSHLSSQSGTDSKSGSVNVYKIEMSLYPNPAQDYFRLKTDQQIKHIGIYNIIGKKVKDFAANADHNYPVSNLPKGMYIVRIFGADDQLIKTLRLSKR